MRAALAFSGLYNLDYHYTTNVEVLIKVEVQEMPICDFLSCGFAKVAVLTLLLRKYISLP